MSLDVGLYEDKPEGGCLFDYNITHSLNKMAMEAGIYEACWRPEEIGATHARDILPLLNEGLIRLVMEPTRFSQFDSPNGWGIWENFVRFVAFYRESCSQHPDARIAVSR